MAAKKSTNEWEFQGQVTDWLNAEIKRRAGLGLDRATQEKPGGRRRRRNDLVIWVNRASESALLAIELKTPSTAITSPSFLMDAIAKAQRWKAPFFAIWNMQAAASLRPWVTHYNHQRSHRSLGKNTPMARIRDARQQAA